MKVISLFSGCGGLDLGFAFAGHQIVWANDFDEDAIKTYNTHIGKYFNHNAICQDIVKLLDTTKETINELIPDGDIVIGGFPCQGFSIANIDRNMEDERNFLYLQLLKVISAKQPKYFLLENVKGLENMENGKILPTIMDDLENAGTIKSKFFPSVENKGYTIVYNIVNSLLFGVPEKRERVIILGIRNDIFPNSPLKSFIAEANKNKKYDHRKRLQVWYTHSQTSEKNEEISPVNKVNNLYHLFANNQIQIKEPTKSSTLYKTTTLQDAIGDLPEEYDDKIPNHQGSKCKVRIRNAMGNRATFWNKYSPTITARGSGTGGPLIPPHPNAQRRFTVRECARIQTFPDQIVFAGSNSSGYRQIGNAVPVLMAYNLALMFNKK